MTPLGDKVTFKIAAAAAPYIGADKPRADRLRAAAGGVELPPADLVLLVYYLCNDPDPEVKRTALATLKGLEVPFLSKLLADPQLHTRILDVLAKLHHDKPELAPLFAAHPMLSAQAAAFLAQRGPLSPPAPQAQPQGKEQAAPPAPAPGAAVTHQAKDAKADDAEDAEEVGEVGEVGEAGDDEPVDEEDEQFQSKYQLAQEMGISEKIKMAMTGDKEWRTIFIKDNNKLVSGAVIKNPRLTENEVLTIAKSAVQNDEIIRGICANKEWVKNPLIRRALVENCKTPLPVALRFIPTLSERDLSFLAKSKNVPTVVATQARRILLNKKQGR